MEFQQPKKRNDKCDEIKVRFDDKETVDNQRNDKCEEINSYTSDEKVTFGLEDDFELELYDYSRASFYAIIVSRKNVA